MNSAEYMKQALVTEPLKLDAVLARLASANAIRLLHAQTGISSEAGEFSDAVKRYVFYGKPIDKVNILEEAGDLLWYIVVALDSCNYTIEDAMDKNIAKLRARYGEKFTEAAALQRDLDNERKVLEAGA